MKIFVGIVYSMKGNLYFHISPEELAEKFKEARCHDGCTIEESPTLKGDEEFQSFLAKEARNRLEMAERSRQFPIFG